MRRVILILIACFLLLAAVVVSWSLIRPSDWIVSRVSRVDPRVVFRVETPEHVIALTIDDGPHPDVTLGILRVLRANETRATFFIIGSNAEAYPELIDSIRADGHELANHLYTDRLSARLSDEEFLDELRRTDALIEPLGSPRWCRPGSGVITSRMADIMVREGYTPVAATAYPMDLHAGVGMSAKQFLDNVRPGAILVLHDGGPDRAETVDVLERVLPRIREMGYRATTLTELSNLGRMTGNDRVNAGMMGRVSSPPNPGK